MKRTAVLLLALGCLAASRPKVPDRLAVRAIVGEAAGQSYREKLAIAGALRNRGTLKGVYGVNAAHVDREPTWVWRQAQRAWAESATNNIVRGATAWENLSLTHPAWAKRMTVTVKIGKTTFFK